MKRFILSILIIGIMYAIFTGTSYAEEHPEYSTSNNFITISTK